MPLYSQSGYNPGQSYTNTSGVDGTPVDFARALLAREQNFLQRRAVAQPEQPRMVRYISGAPSGGGQYSRDDSSPMPQAQPQAKGRPVFVKTVGGFGITPGTIRLNQWEPGAAFAGYESDLGSGPAAASFSGALASRSMPEAPFDPYEGRRMSPGNVAEGDAADRAYNRLKAAYGRG